MKCRDLQFGEEHNILRALVPSSELTAENSGNSSKGQIPVCIPYDGAMAIGVESNCYNAAVLLVYMHFGEFAFIDTLTKICLNSRITWS